MRRECDYSTKTKCVGGIGNIWSRGEGISFFIVRCEHERNGQGRRVRERYEGERTGNRWS